MELWKQYLPDPAQPLAQQKELTLLTMCIWGEARGSSHLAQRAVGFVVRNRVMRDSSQFGHGWREVLLKPYQFSVFDAQTTEREKTFYPLRFDSLETWKACFAAALIAYESLYADPTLGSAFYYSGDDAPGWADGMSETLCLADFTFLSDVK